MKIRCHYISFLVFLLIGVSCSQLPISKSEKVIQVPATPTPLTYAQAKRETLEYLLGSFKRCANDKGRDLTYAISGQYLVEIQDFRCDTWPSILGLTPTDLSRDITWEGTVPIIAEVTGKYDILNQKWSYEEGRGDEKIFFSVKREEGKWKCEDCQRYKAISCEEVEKILKEKPRYAH
jgi:hypothetical protein